MNSLIGRLRASSVFTPVIFASLFVTAPMHANPLNGVVVDGQATITTIDPKTLIINQGSNRAIINWKSFNIKAGETTRFVQPSKEAWTLNRVIGSQDPSRILGSLQANGNIVLVNPDGIHFGSGSRVDVNRLIATTNNISNENFMAGRLIFDQPGNPSASIVNEGTITVKELGLAAFVAPAVRNSGVITARLGQVSLASGNKFTIDPYGDGLIKLSVDDEITSQIYDVATGKPITDLVKNEGTLKANGGTVAMTAVTARRVVNSVINNTGVIEANSVSMRGGKIILGARTASSKRSGTPKQIVRVSGRVSAKSYPVPTRIVLPTPAPRGHIKITGETIVATNAIIDASGTNGGGTVLIGGDYLGGNAEPALVASLGFTLENKHIPTASYVALDETVTIRADAIESGNGGKVVVWSDEATLTAATITARGGNVSGNGGFIETSGKYLNAVGTADASAANGTAGTWLIDPLDLEVRNIPVPINLTTTFQTLFTNISVQGTSIPIVSGFDNRPIGPGSVLSTSSVQSMLNGGTSVRIITLGTVGPASGHITFVDDILKTAGGDAFLNVISAGNIILNNGVEISSTAGKLHLSLNARTGSVTGNNIKIDVNSGTFLTEARDGINLSSSFDLPNDTTISLRSGASPNAVVNVLMNFGGDKIEFSHNNATATFGASSIELTDTSANSNLAIHLGNLNTVLKDNAVTITNNRVLTWLLFGNNVEFGVDAASNSNNVAEISSNGQVFLQFDNAGLPMNPVSVEVSNTNTPTCFGLTCVAVNGVGVVPTPAAPVVDTPTDTPPPPDEVVRIDFPNSVLNPGGETANSTPAFPSDISSESDLDLLSLGYDEFGNKIDLWAQPLNSSEAASALLPYAFLSDAVYNDTSNVAGWKRVKTWEEILRDGLSKKSASEADNLIEKMKNDGFYAAVFEKDGEYVLAFRGSDGRLVTDYMNTNIPQALHGTRIDNQYSYALQLTIYASGQFDASKLTLTGHSLGGGLAQYASSEFTAVKAITFNAAGINSPNFTNDSDVINVRVEDDLASSEIITTQIGGRTYEFDSTNNRYIDIAFSATPIANAVYNGYKIKRNHSMDNMISSMYQSLNR